MYTTQLPELFVTHREGFFITNTGNKNSIVVDDDLSIVQQPTSSLLDFDSVKIIL